MEKRKKGVSPVVATVLLIAIVIVLALIVFLWARGFVKESVQKQGKSADQVCDEIDLEVSYDGEEVVIVNNGNIPIYRFEIKKESGGSIELEEVEEGLLIGETKILGESGEFSGYDKIMVFPVILGESKLSKKAYTCKNSFDAEPV